MQSKRTAPLAGGYTTRNTLVTLERLALRAHSAPELASALDVDVRSARRLLHRLAEDGYVVQDAGHRRRYRLTLRLIATAGPLLARSSMPRLAAPLLRELADATGATAHLWVSGRAGVCCLAHGAPGSAVDLSVRIDEPIAGGTTAPDAVLDQGRHALRASMHLRDGRATTSVAGVVERGRIVAAVGLTGPGELADLAEVHRAAGRLGAALEQAA